MHHDVVLSDAQVAHPYCIVPHYVYTISHCRLPPLILQIGRGRHTTIIAGASGTCGKVVGCEDVPAMQELYNEWKIYMKLRSLQDIIIPRLHGGWMWEQVCSPFSFLSH